MKQPSQEDLLGYMLGALDAHEHEQVQEQIDQDPTLEEKLLGIKAALAPLELVNELAGPPPGLARRCCQYVAVASRSADAERLVQFSLPSGRDNRARATQLALETQASPTGQVFQKSDRVVEYHPEERLHRRGWTVMDFVFACAAAMLVGALLLPALSVARFNSRIAACQDNLRSLFDSFVAYADSHGGRYPKIPKEGPLSSAGCVGPILKEAGLIADDRVFVCAGLADPSQTPIRIPLIDEVLQAKCETEIQNFRRGMSGHYGYSLGYLENGVYCEPRQGGSNNYVIVSDRPNCGSTSRISRNHGGWGQNCLMADGSIRFNRGGVIGNDSIFVNDMNIVAPGVSPDDCVVAPSHVQAFPQAHRSFGAAVQ